MVGLPWAAYGVSAAYYYKKSMKENTVGGVVYDKALKDRETEDVIEKEDAEEV